MHASTRNQRCRSAFLEYRSHPVTVVRRFWSLAIGRIMTSIHIPCSGAHFRAKCGRYRSAQVWSIVDSSLSLSHGRCEVRLHISNHYNSQAESSETYSPSRLVGCAENCSVPCSSSESFSALGPRNHRPVVIPEIFRNLQ